MSFQSEIKEFRRKVEKAADLVFRGTALEIFSKVVKRTPVKTGRLRGNWQCEINAIPIGEVDSTPAQALTKIVKITGQMKFTDSIYLINNLPYVEVIENGSSEQAPQGMVKITVAEFRDTVAKNAAKVK